jgi:hypothetical protein
MRWVLEKLPHRHGRANDGTAHGVAVPVLTGAGMDSIDGKMIREVSRLVGGDGWARSRHQSVREGAQGPVAGASVATGKP